jgi:hypothetical protein
MKFEYVHVSINFSFIFDFRKGRDNGMSVHNLRTWPSTHEGVNLTKDAILFIYVAVWEFPYKIL